MSGKDLLAVLAIVVPTFLLIVTIAFTRVQPAEVATAPAGAGYGHASAGTEKIHEGRNDSKRAVPQIATQKLMRDPWEKAAYAKSKQASE